MTKIVFDADRGRWCAVVAGVTIASSNNLDVMVRKYPDAEVEDRG